LQSPILIDRLEFPTECYGLFFPAVLQVKEMIDMRKSRFRGVGIGMAGSGALMTAISFFVNDPYWFLLTGTVFIVMGIALFFFSRTGRQ
jgi:hypothetical protein